MLRADSPSSAHGFMKALHLCWGTREYLADVGCGVMLVIVRRPPAIRGLDPIVKGMSLGRVIFNYYLSIQRTATGITQHTKGGGWYKTTLDSYGADPLHVAMRRLNLATKPALRPCPVARTRHVCSHNLAQVPHCGSPALDCV